MLETPALEVIVELLMHIPRQVRALHRTIEQLAGGNLEWRISPGAGWDTCESITFFWQTTQPPSGPGGRFNPGSALSDAANGPLPTPVAAVASAQPLALFALGLLGMIGVGRMRQ